MRFKLLNGLATSLSVVGAINRGLVGLFRLNPVARLLGRSRPAERTAYLTVGLAGVWLRVAHLLPKVLIAMGVRGEDPLLAAETRSLVGRTMPSVSGTTLCGREVAIPRDTLGMVTVLAMGFSYHSRFHVEDWLQAFQARFGRDPDLVFYEMAMIDEPYRRFAGAIGEGMRRASAPEGYDHLITVYASQKPLRQALGAAGISDTWVYLLDAEGRVQFQCGSPFEAERFQELAWQTESALARANAPSQPTLADW